MRQLAAQALAFLLSSSPCLAGLLARRLLLLAARIEETLAARLALAGLVVALDDLRLDEAEPAGAPKPGDVVARTAQLWPHRHGTDAMFLALLRAPEA